MTSVRRSAALVGTAALLASGVSVAASPVASAQVWHETPAWDVEMPYPLGGEHTIRFGVLAPCSLGEDGEFHQAMSANAWDVDQPVNSFDFSATMFPFNSATVEWHNIDTDERGSETVFTTGPEVGTASTITGQGTVAVTITVTKSLLPTFAPGSAVPFGSATHTEHFLIQPKDCSQVGV